MNNTSKVEMFQCGHGYHINCTSKYKGEYCCALCKKAEVRRYPGKYEGFEKDFEEKQKYEEENLEEEQKEEENYAEKIRRKRLKDIIRTSNKRHIKFTYEVIRSDAYKNEYT